MTTIKIKGIVTMYRKGETVGSICKKYKMNRHTLMNLISKLRKFGAKIERPRSPQGLRGIDYKALAEELNK